MNLPPAVLACAGPAVTGVGEGAQGGMWRRKGWAAMDSLRERLEVLKELRDLVRSLGRGGGWGPLRRAPQQVSTGPPCSTCRRAEVECWASRLGHVLSCWPMHAL